MALTKEQIDFGSARNTTVIGTAANLMNFFKPINEEGLILKDFRSSLLGGMGCFGSLGIGCFGSIILGFAVGIICAICDLSDNLITVLCVTTIITILEFSIINYFYNKIFTSKHAGAPEDSERLSSLIMPFIGFLSQDMSDEEQITVKSALVPIDSETFMLSQGQIKQLGKEVKRGLSMYSGELLDVSARLADGTSASFNVSDLLSTVYVYKKHGNDKRACKEKVTIKACFAFPANTYGETRGGEFNLDENTSAVVTTSEKRVKVVIKKVLADAENGTNSKILITNQQILNGCIDAMAAAYSLVG